VSVHILFFGSVAERVGRRECTLPVDESMRLATLLDELGCDGFKPLLLAVNQQQVSDMDMRIKAGDEVAIMPPFSGG